MADETRDDRPGGTPASSQDSGGAKGTPPENEPRSRAGGRDAIDRARDEEVQEHEEHDGAAFPNPGGGAVVAPPGERRGDPATEHEDDGLGAGDEMRGGGSGPVPPGTGKPLPGTKREAADAHAPGAGEAVRSEAAPGSDPMRPGATRAAAEPDLRRADPTARTVAEAGAPMPGDGPTAREIAPAEGAEGSPMHALGVEAGRNGWVLWVLGIAAIAAGVIALAMPFVASFAANVVVAAMLVASGAVGLFTSARRRDGGAIAMGFALSGLAIVAGVLMLIAPLAGIVALSTLIVAFFLASGAMKIWWGVRRAEMRGRGWLIASGVLSVALALMLWLAFPASALWLPGVLLAVDLILYGALMISLAVFGRPKLDAERMA
jgi:uncharacterized membrane protein HdeD (DUF308 family)